MHSPLSFHSYLIDIKNVHHYEETKTEFRILRTRYILL